MVHTKRLKKPSSNILADIFKNAIPKTKFFSYFLKIIVLA
jgi:hypothetical protein